MNGSAEAFTAATADDMRGELARFLTRATGAVVAAIDFDESALEAHLRMNLRLRDAAGKVLAESRDLEVLRQRFGEQAGHAFAARAGRELAAEGLKEFPAQPIPLQVPGEAGVPAWPALVAQGDSVALRVFADRAEAEAAHPQGVRRLLEIALADKVKQARKQLPVSPKTGLLYAAIESQERLRGDLVDVVVLAAEAGRQGQGHRPGAGIDRAAEQRGEIDSGFRDQRDPVPRPDPACDQAMGHAQRILAQFGKRINPGEIAARIVKIQPAAALRGIVERFAECGEIRKTTRQNAAIGRRLKGAIGHISAQPVGLTRLFMPSFAQNCVRQALSR